MKLCIALVSLGSRVHDRFGEFYKHCVAGQEKSPHVFRCKPEAEGDDRFFYLPGEEDAFNRDLLKLIRDSRYNTWGLCAIAVPTEEELQAKDQAELIVTLQGQLKELRESIAEIESNARTLALAEVEELERLRTDIPLLRARIEDFQKNEEAVRLKQEQDKEAEADGIAAAAAEKDREASQEGAPESSHASGSTSAPDAARAAPASESETGVVSPPTEKVTTGQLPDEPPQTGTETEGTNTQAPVAPADGADSTAPAKAAKKRAAKKATEGQGQ